MKIEQQCDASSEQRRWPLMKSSSVWAAMPLPMFRGLEFVEVVDCDTRCSNCIVEPASRLCASLPCTEGFYQTKDWVETPLSVAQEQSYEDQVFQEMLEADASACAHQQNIAAKQDVGAGWELCTREEAEEYTCVCGERSESVEWSG